MPLTSPAKHSPLHGLRLLPAAMALATAGVCAHAAPLAYVASDGNDARAGGRCTLAAPCRTFQAAHDVVDAGGQVVALDSAEYGPVTITKSVSIVGGAGYVAGISVVAGNGVTIATAGVDVVLRNLHIQGAGGARGVDMSAGHSLTIENSVVANLAGDGIHVGAVQRASIADTVARGNGGHGAHLSQGRTNVSNSRFMANGGSGFYLEAGALGATAAVSDSVASGNGNRGFSARGLLNGTYVTLSRVTASNNGGAGIANELLQTLAEAKMVVSDSTSTGNATGIYSTSTLLISNCMVYTLGNNIVMFNQTNTEGIVSGPAGI